MADTGWAPMRLQKFLARAGAGGRRRCERFIQEGRVAVNGATITEMGVQVDPVADEVALDGVRMVLPADAITLALNKPAGACTTMHDQKDRVCVADYLPMEEHPALYHIGRLDRDTTGILLFTTDGDLGNHLLHPSHHVDKEYITQVKGVPTEDELDRLRAGITIRQGERTHECAPAEVEVLPVLPKRYRIQDSCLDPALPGTAFVRICIHEGVKHQVKLMFGAIGHPVAKLHRSMFGGISCGTLKQGEWRVLEGRELAALQPTALS